MTLKIKLLYLIIIFFFIGKKSLIGQQSTQYSQWMTHQLSFNPAYAGIKPCVEIQTAYRTQWIGINGAPKCGFLTASVPLAAKRTNYLSPRHGFALKVENEKVGQFTSNKFNLGYAGHYNFSKVNRISLGLFGGFNHFGYEHATSVTIDPDPKVFQEASLFMPDASVGAWWNGANYYLGASFQNLFRNKWKGVGLESRYRIQTYLDGGIRYKTSQDVTLLFGMLFKVPPTGRPSVDIDLLYDFKNIIGFGGGYRVYDAIKGFFFFKIDQRFVVQYSVDYNISPLRAGISHEFSFSFSACKPDITGPIKTEMF